MNFNYKKVQEWPLKSWLVIIKENSEIIVLHGSEVEIREEFFCEAVWDGEFIEGDFDNTDIVFGSGARIRGDKIFFVSSCSTFDRLHHYVSSNNDIIVSNSLVCLLSFIDEKLDPTYKKYYFDFLSITKGINKYKKFIRTLNDKKIYLTYYRNLKWDGKAISECEKKEKTTDISSFDKYYQFLSNSIDNIFSNADDHNRRFVLNKLGTMSRGYDSTTVTAIAKKSGLKEVISFDQARSGRSDCGSDIARVINVKITKILREAWKLSELSVIPFIAGEGRGEDVTFFGIPDSLIRNRIFLTGYHGDVVWKKYSNEHNLSDELVRGDIGGLSLTEYRLWKGFIHVPVPFIGARKLHDINKVSNSEEMKEWNIPGHYNRPICRRIVEELGVPRNAFGQRKQVTTVEISNRWTFIPDNSQKIFYSWLKCQRHIFKQKKKIFPDNNVRFIVNTYRRIMLKSVNMIIRIFGKYSTRISEFRKSYAHRRLGYDCWFEYLFPWAVENAKNRYKTKDL